MKIVLLYSMIVISALFSACRTSPHSCQKNNFNLEVTGSIEITEYNVEQIGNRTVLVLGKIVDEFGDPLIGAHVYLENTEFRTTSDVDGNFRFAGIPLGKCTLTFNLIGYAKSSVELNLAMGDRITLTVAMNPDNQIQLEKPIIYLYPEEETEVHISLDFEGIITTTYPTYPSDGWTVTAHPNGTLFDENGKEYYALYWEGDPHSPLGITDGFVVSKEETIPFLEEKLVLLGLNAREANEFIVFWLPILEKNPYNLIHFSGDDYLNQAKLTVTPQPQTMIRIAMIFQGLDDPITIPLQDLTPLKKTRKGFTLVEWGGQELPKAASKEI